jgi:TRAP-type mannitol/chloroaromatic compound transport system permease small subunit
MMQMLLAASRKVDALNLLVGRSVRWLILAAVLISAGNAVVRKAFQTSSNALLEIQWYLFSAVFLLCAAYALLRNAHVRIDFVSVRLSARARSWIDIAGIVFFAVPFCWLLVQLSLPLVLEAFQTDETSSNAGGLLRWPVYALVPLGMALLLLQCISELVKHVAFLRGLLPSAALHASSEGDPQDQPGPPLVDVPASLPDQEVERRWN